MRGSSSQVEGGTVGEKMHMVRSVTTGRATTAVVWEVDDVAALEGKILKKSRVRSITASTADANGVRRYVSHRDCCIGIMAAQGNSEVEAQTR